MAAKIIDGKAHAKTVCDKVKEDIQWLGRNPKLIIISVGDDPASKIYVRNKMRTAESVGIIAEHYTFSADAERYDVVQFIEKCNADDMVDGIMLQLPLPEGWDPDIYIDLIAPHKDVDGLTDKNKMAAFIGYQWQEPCTALGVMRMLAYEGISVGGKNVVIVGRSEIVGKPLARMMLDRNATVTICHSHTANLAEHTKLADILIVAVGKPNLVTADMVKSGAVVIDVGINRDENGKMCGDVDFNNVKEVASYITPVPGGVGPMTVAMLMSNVVSMQ